MRGQLLVIPLVRFHVVEGFLGDSLCWWSRIRAFIYQVKVRDENGAIFTAKHIRLPHLSIWTVFPINLLGGFRHQD